jgi:hypothetical protein
MRMNRNEILETAHSLINGDRKEEYGDAKESFTDIATIWSIILNHKVQPKDVAMCMVALKVNRFVNSKNGHKDSLIDICGYAALAGEMIDD